MISKQNELIKPYQAASRLFKVLGHPTRLMILNELRDGEQCVCHLEYVSGLRQAHISQHLMVLRDAGLVIDHRDGWNIFYQVIKPDIYAVIDAMDATNGITCSVSKKPTRTGKHECPCPKCHSKQLKDNQ